MLEKIFSVCDGSGTLHFETSRNEYQVDCETCRGQKRVKPGSQENQQADDCSACNGKGFVLPEKAVLLKKFERGAVYLNSLILGRMKEHLDNILFYPPEIQDPHSFPPVKFTFDGGLGVIMPVIPPRSEEVGHV